MRLACTLLDTCGHFFAKGQARKRLERYLAFLQRYVLGKPALPLDMEYDLQASWVLVSGAYELLLRSPAALHTGQAGSAPARRARPTGKAGEAAHFGLVLVCGDAFLVHLRDYLLGWPTLSLDTKCKLQAAFAGQWH